jgi:hypothetical protein
MLVALLWATPSFGQPWSGILDPARAIDWSYAGIPGGIPTGWANCVTTECNTLNGGTVTPASINAALASAPDNSVVRIPAGSWTLSAATYSNRGDVILRGAGPTQTTLTLNGVNLRIGTAGTGFLGSYPPNLGSTNWTGGLTRGSTVLTVASTSGMAAGQRVVLDQLNDAWVFTTGVEGTCISGNSCGRNDTPLQFNGASTRAQPQMVEIVSIDSATQMTIAAPGVAFDHTAGLDPEVFYWNTAGAEGPGNIQYAGVENMKIVAGGEPYALGMSFCDYCWVKNVAVTGLGRSAVIFWWSYRNEIRDSYISASNTSGAPTEYGFEVQSTTFVKIENNIIYGVTSPVLPESSYGLVVGYNYILNTASGNMFGEIEPHLSHNFLQLFEGNVGAEIMYDNSWGSSSHNTAFRNRMSGFSANKTNYRIALKINAHNHYMNIVGNVLGDSSHHTRYRCDNVDTTTTDNHVYEFGFWNNCGAGLTDYDTVTQSTLMRWGNWDVVTNAVRWCGNSSNTGWSTTCASTSEVPTADATFPNAVPATETLPNSFYLSAKPSWFGSVAWPPIGPDVTGGNIANTGGHANKNPAQVCYDATAKDGNGFLTAFDADACYADSPAGGRSRIRLRIRDEVSMDSRTYTAQSSQYAN